MHGGHLSLIRRYCEIEEVKEIIVFIGKTQRDVITQDVAHRIAEILVRGESKVRLVKCDLPTPVTTLYKFMQHAPEGRYAVAASKKDDDTDKVEKFVRDFKEGGKYNRLIDGIYPAVLSVDIEPLTYSGRYDSFEGSCLSSSVLREDVKRDNFESFKSNYPNTPLIDVMTIWTVLRGEVDSATNLHMPHVEDLIYCDGIHGPVKCLTMFQRGFMGAVNKDSSLSRITVKYDGSPAVFVWSKFNGLPDNGVAIKSLFGKSRKVITTEQDCLIQFGDRPDLMKKMMALLRIVPDMNLPNGEIWQGDYMYDNNIVNEDPPLSFSPNTLVYVVPTSHPDIERIKSSSIGIVWHTRYVGDDIERVKVTYDVSRDEITCPPGAYWLDHSYPLNDLHLNLCDKFLFGVLLQELKVKVRALVEHDIQFAPIVNNARLVEILKMYDNYLIRENLDYINGQYVKNLLKFIDDRKCKDVAKLKTDAGKERTTRNYDELTRLILDNETTMTNIAGAVSLARTLKHHAIKFLDKKTSLETFIKYSDGNIRKTSHEGYVMNCDGFAAKLVNRREFSHANFDDNVLRGWNR